MTDEEAVAALARILGHETCLRLIEALGAGEATVSDLACRLHLEQPRISTHLALLRDAGIVECQASGRQRVYALRGQAPAMAVATLRTLAASLAGDDAKGAGGDAGAEDGDIRRARTCYDHLAGVAGVALLDRFLDGGWLEQGEGRELRLTGYGVTALARMGVNVQAARRSRRAFAIECADWTERRPHLGGALGAAVLTALLDQGRARLRPGERVVDLSPGEPVAFCESAGV